MNAIAPEAYDGSSSFPAPTVNLLNSPLILPVLGDIAACHRFFVSPLSAEKTTRLSAARQQPGLGAFGIAAGNELPAWSGAIPAWAKASYAPVSTARLPSIAEPPVHAELAAFADVYPTTSRRLPSGDHTG